MNTCFIFFGFSTGHVFLGKFITLWPSMWCLSRNVYYR